MLLIVFQAEVFYSLVLMFLLLPLTGKAYEDHPHLGAAGVIAKEFLPKAEDEGETDQYFPQAGIINTNPANIVDKALKCFHDKNVSNSRLHPHHPPEQLTSYN